MEWGSDSLREREREKRNENEPKTLSHNRQRKAQNQTYRLKLLHKLGTDKDRQKAMMTQEGKGTSQEMTSSNNKGSKVLW